MSFHLIKPDAGEEFVAPPCTVVTVVISPDQTSSPDAGEEVVVTLYKSTVRVVTTVLGDLVTV